METYSSLSSRISVSASRRICASSVEPLAGSSRPPGAVSFGSASRAGASVWRTALGSTPSLRSTGTTTPSGCSSRTASRCSGVVCGFRRSSANRCAAWSASCDLIVNRSGCMFGVSVLRRKSKDLSRYDSDYDTPREPSQAQRSTRSLSRNRDTPPAPRGRSARDDDDLRLRLALDVPAGIDDRADHGGEDPLVSG